MLDQPPAILELALLGLLIGIGLEHGPNLGQPHARVALEQFQFQRRGVTARRPLRDARRWG